MRTIIVPAHFECATDEVEFDRLLDVVRMALAPSFDQPALAANDNQLVWPLIPFPENWWGCGGPPE
jgi:hypothetical protein